jgi:hypothetical protein
MKNDRLLETEVFRVIVEHDRFLAKAKAAGRSSIFRLARGGKRPDPALVLGGKAAIVDDKEGWPPRRGFAACC